MKLITEGLAGVENWVPYDKIRYEPVTDEVHLISREGKILATLQATEVLLNAQTVHATGAEGVVYVNPR